MVKRKSSAAAALDLNPAEPLPHIGDVAKLLSLPQCPHLQIRDKIIGSHSHIVRIRGVNAHKPSQVWFEASSILTPLVNRSR